MAFNVGLNVVEVDGSAAPAIVGAAVSVAGFNIQTRRGVPNRPTRVTSFQQFVDQFGGFFASGLGPYMIKGFFDNGGQTAYVNRVVSTDPATGHKPASLDLSDGSNPTLRLEAGQRGTVDPGSWGDDLYVRVSHSSSAETRVRETARASVTGTVALAETTDMSGFSSLSVRIDDEDQATEITFQASDFANPAQASRAEIRDAVNRRTTKVEASIDEGNHLVLTSTGQLAALSRDWSRLQVTAANPTLGFAAAAEPVPGTAAARTTTGTTLASIDGFAPGDAIRVSDGTRTATAKLLRVQQSGAVEWAPEIANIADFDVFATRISTAEFDLVVAAGGTEDDDIVEVWPNLSMEADRPNHAPKVLNDPIRGSRYLVATDRGSTSPAGADRPQAADFTRLGSGTVGVDGTPTVQDFAGGSAAKTGFSAFDPVDVQLLACERTDPAVVSAALGYCERRGDCTFVGSVPEGYVAAGQAGAYGRSFQGKKVYGALYGPWIKVLDPLGSGAQPYKWVPPAGHVMGVYARIESSRGVWKAPAGDEARVIGALDVEHHMSDADHTDLVKNGSVNGIRAMPGAGIVVDASRTLSTDTRWLYVNVRLLFNHVKSSLKQGLRWVRQEPNRDSLWNAIKFGSVTPFLMGLWRQGAFGTGKPEEVFTVIVDATNNPPEEVEKGNLKVEVYFYPSRPAETIVIIVGQQPSGASASEA